MTRVGRQNGFILMPVIIAIVLVATIAFLLNNQSAINVTKTGDMLEAEQAEQLTRAGLAHAVWGAQNSGCAGDMAMTTVPFGQAGTGSYTSTVTTPGGATTAYPNLAADQDAWFRSDQPTVNNGTNADMHLRMESGNLEYALYRFDLSSLPAGSQINSASMWLYVTPTGPGGGAHPEGPLTIHRVISDWTETGATWDTMSSHFDSTVIATIPAQPQDAVWVQVNLTAQVQAWVNGGEANYGIMLIPTGEGTHGKYVSREGTAPEQPRLDVIVGTGPASPMDINVTGTLTGNPSPANDNIRSLTRTDVPVYQPPGTVTLQLGTDPGEDTFLDSFYDLRNYGGANYLQVHDNGSDWQQYPLLRFDLAGLPRGAAVRSAQLELRLQSLNAPGTATIHQVTRSWVEGTKSGGGIADGATWFTHDGTNPWTSAGGDINAPVVAETAINGGETWVSWDIAPLVERWLAGEPNYGVLIKPDSALNEARFASKEDSNLAVQPRLTITYACECGSSCLAPQGSGTVALVVVDPTNLVPADFYKKALFESWGYTLNLIGETTNAAGYMTAAASNDVFYISETVNNNQVGVRIKDVPIGVVSEDGAYNSNLGFATGSAWPVGSSVNVTDTSHYITALFPTGALDIYHAAMEQLTVSGTPATGLQPLADSGGAGSLLVLDKAATMSGGGSAAGRRVMLPLGREAKFNWDYLNSNGRLLVQRALQWGTGNTGSAPTQNLLFVAAGTSPTAQEQLRIDLIESWGYGVTVIDDNDSQANFDVAVAANDVAYVSSTVSDAALGTKLKAAPIGLVNEQGALVDEFGFGLQSVNYKSRIEIDVLDNTHYITTPFPTGLLTVLTGNQMLHIMTANKAPGFDALAQVFNTGSLWDDSLGVIDIGGDLYGGGTAAGRRVLLPWGDATFDVTSLNADGRTIMQRAIEWAEGAGSTPAPAYNVLLIVGNLTLSSKDVGYKALMESWGYTVTLIDDGDSQANYDAAMAAADVVYASGSALGSNMLDKATNTTKGLVNEVVGKIDNFGFSSSTTSTVNTDTFSKTDAAHYITEPFGGNPVTVFTTSLTNPVPGGTLAPDLQNVGEVTGTLALGTLDTGATRWDSSPSLGRRVHLPFASAEATDLTADGKTILQRALEWAAGAGSGGGGPGYTELYQAWSATSDDTWQTVDLGTFGVPANAVVEVAVINSDSGKEYFGGVRAVGSSLERRFALHEAEGGGVDAVTMHVQTDASSQIQHYSDKGNRVSFILLGYWTGATYVERFDAFKAGANASWQSHDLGSYGVAANQVAEIAMSQTSTSVEWQVGARRLGSSLARQLTLHEAEGGGIDMVTLMTETDASSMVEVYAEANSVVDFHLLGYWNTPPGAYTETGGVQGQASSSSTWETANLTGFGVPANSIAQFVISNQIDNFSRELGVREVGSGNNRVIDLQEAEAGGGDLATMHVNVDSASSIEWYSASGTSERFFYPVGWWVLP